ncbi:winged helix-turn-helix transcriptional regulator [Streptomyces sp. NPDC059604]|uniref:winged helix-turn-helix transcriptional regulator n=1 Tax=Streptomyces sp. NPDC059604 TaxID=3346881 RepID=UPI00367C082E
MTTPGLPPAFDADTARVTETLSMITPRWNVRVLLAMRDRPLRYAELANKLPWLQAGQLHPKVRSLVDTGLVERTEHSARHVTYGLTRRGTELLSVLPLLATWADRFLEKPGTPASAIENIEDGLALLTRRQAPAILWALKSRQEASARTLAHIVIPDGYWTSIYPPLRQLVDDGLVVTAGDGHPYRLSPAGDGLGPTLGALSTWAAGRPLTQAGQHPVWGRPEQPAPAPRVWITHQPWRPTPSTTPATTPAVPAAQSSDLFSHAAPPRPTAAVVTGGPRR